MTNDTGQTAPWPGDSGDGETRVLPAVDAPFVPTHLIPAEGMAAWDVPDPARVPIAHLDPGLPVRLFEQRPDGWAHVGCSNGWSTWLDGRLLAHVDPLATDDALWAALQDAVTSYGRLVDELEAGALDAETFSARALRVGLIVRDHDAWLLDLPTKRWWRYDGISLSTIDIGDRPSAEPGGR